MAAAGGCFFRIKESYASLSPKEQQIADYLTQHPRQASGMSLEELAAVKLEEQPMLLRAAGDNVVVIASKFARRFL